MDSLQVGQSGSSKSSSRSASPCRPHSAHIIPQNTSHLHHVVGKRSADASSGGSGSSGGGGGGGGGRGEGANVGASMSGSVKGRRKSPVALRKDKVPTDGGGAAGVGGGGGGTGAAAGTGSGGGGGVGSGATQSPRPEALSAQGSEEEKAAHSGPEEDADVCAASSSVMSNGSSEQVMAGIDDVDGHLQCDITRTRAAIEHMQSKIGRTKDLIRGEQTTRDDNVNEYLKLAANADKQQLLRIKAVFEKKNQKSAQSISQLQKKLESYNKRLRDLEMHGLPSTHRQPREVLRDMGQGLKNVGGNIRDGITGLSGTVMSKPREFAHLIKNKFGSADNINSLSRNGDSSSVDEEKTHHGSATLPGGCGLGSTTASAHASSSAGLIKYASEEGSECSSVTSESLPAVQTSPHHHTAPVHLSTTFSLDPILTELQERREEFDRMREEIEAMKQALQQEVSFLSQALQEERFRSERLEEQVNDLTELHQNEVENLKQAITDMEEKVQYQSEERLRDIHEMLECCQTKISKMEHQQQQHQQYVTLEGIDNSNARALVVKLINVVLTVLQVVLLLVATAAGIVMPFLRTRLRILSTIILVAGIVFVLKQWPEVRDVGNHLMRHLKEALSVK